MSDQGSDDDQTKQRMDAMLLRLLKTPPKSRAELAEELRRAKSDKPTRVAQSVPVLKKPGSASAVMEMRASWLGLYSWPSFEKENELPELPALAGVYLFTIEYADGYLIYAAGITSDFANASNNTQGNISPADIPCST